MNHHVRNAIFPLCLAVQKGDDVNGQKICDDATNRINIALREAVTDVFSQKVTRQVCPRRRPTRHKDLAAFGWLLFQLAVV